MTEHTPGPWRKTAGYIASNKGVVAVYVPSRGSIMHWADDNAASSELEANARLIAAAPELLEALENLHATARTVQAMHEQGAGDARIAPEVFGQACTALIRAKGA